MAETVEQKFLRRITRGDESECWPWPGARDSGGYGSITVFDNGKRSTQRAHRVAYRLLRGPIPPGMTLDHLCRVRHCANPWHMEVVTRGENVRRGFPFRPKRQRTHCTRGHELTLTPSGRLSCKPCTLARYHARKVLRRREQPMTCRNGHPWVDQQCPTCVTERHARYWQRNRERLLAKRHSGTRSQPTARSASTRQKASSRR